MSGRGTQRGVALITALVITAIAATALVALTSRQFIDVRRTGNVLAAEQAWHFNLGMESVAASLLSQWARNNTYTDPETLFQPQTFPIEGGVISGQMSDLQGRFNLNSLVDANGAKHTGNINRFKRLLDLVMAELNHRPAAAEELANAVVDWIDPDQDATFPGGAEATDYLGKDEPYRCADARMGSATELALIEGFDRDLLQGKAIDEQWKPGLLEYVTALPLHELFINVNTADTKVLQSVSGLISASVADGLIQSRQNEVFKQDSAIQSDPAFSTLSEQDRTKLPQEITPLKVQSHYYKVSATASVGAVKLQFTSIMELDSNTKKVTPVARARGTNGI